MKTIVSVVLVIISAACLWLFLSPNCEDAIKREVRSPNGKYIATLYERDCGATTNFSTIVSLRASTDKFNGENGRIFVAEGQFQVSLVWKDDMNLRIECSKCRSNDIFKQEMNWQDISISYYVWNHSLRPKLGPNSIVKRTSCRFSCRVGGAVKSLAYGYTTRTDATLSHGEYDR